MRGRYQGGSLAGFLIIGALLALVLVGGLYGLSRYSAQQNSEVATNDGQDKKQPEKNKDSGSASDDAASDAADTSGGEQKDVSGTDGATSSDAADAQRTPVDDSAENLPATGPAETVHMVVATFALSFAGVHYLRSRAARR